MEYASSQAEMGQDKMDPSWVAAHLGRPCHLCYHTGTLAVNLLAAFGTTELTSMPLSGSLFEPVATAGRRRRRSMAASARQRVTLCLCRCPRPETADSAGQGVHGSSPESPPPLCLRGLRLWHSPPGPPTVALTTPRFCPILAAPRDGQCESAASFRSWVPRHSELISVACARTHEGAESSAAGAERVAMRAAVR